jgi:uroporphyrinogen-III decarboxylase
MTLQLNTTAPTINELHELIKKNLDGKYTCDVVHDRWSVNFSGPKKCVLIKKSGMIGVGVFVNEKKNIVDVDGIVPNQVLDRVVFGNFVTRLLLVSSWNKLEKEVAQVLNAKFS